MLLACDGWEQSDGSLIAARLIAARLGVPFEVVTVLEPLPIYNTDDSDALSVLAELDRRPIREARVRHQIETWVPPGESWLSTFATARSPVKSRQWPGSEPPVSS